jgi:hypothetical protein
MSLFKERDFHIYKFDTLVKVFSEQYTQLTEEEAMYLARNPISSDAIISNMIATPDDLLKYALMHPLTYVETESYDDYNEYALEMKKLC